MIKEKEPEKKELYYKTYLRMIAEEEAEKERKRRKAEKLLRQFEQLKEEEFKRGTGSNVPLQP